MKTEAEVRAKMAEITDIQRRLDENSELYSRWGDTYNLLAWVVGEGDDPTEGDV
jgi:hypothetical protein